MPDHRIREHPILPVVARPACEFFWQDGCSGHARARRSPRPSSPTASASSATTTRTARPQGIFCANGQCAQCTVVADGLPVKSCMVPVAPGMEVEPLDGLPALPDVGRPRPSMRPIETVDVECLIIGGGPAGLTAAIELGKAGVRALIVDDKHRLGGKLVLQTHKFFGSIEACHAGTRGIDIATKLEREVRQFENVRVWLNTTVLAVFSDRKVGVLREGHYFIVQPDILLVAAGAREKSLVFPGNTLPGVYGAGAFQTLVNRDLVRPTERLFIVGGGNVGLIAGYHALQAGIEVVGLCEALPECGGYKVHKDKLVRMGVPIYTSHTIVSANGRDEVESVTIARLDASWRPIPGTEKTLRVRHGARRGRPRSGGRVPPQGAGVRPARPCGRRRRGDRRGLGGDVHRPDPRPRDRARARPRRRRGPAGVAPHRRGPEVAPGDVDHRGHPRGTGTGVFPVFHCAQEIPCNPCTSVCPNHAHP